MPQKVLKFTGINRKVNEFDGSGACEELLNLRPEIGGGHRVVKEKVPVLKNIEYRSLYEHSFGDTSNWIVTNNEGSVLWLKEDGTTVPVTYDLEYEGNAVEVCSADNVLLAYSEALGEQRAFKFEDGEYKPYSFNLRKINDVSIEYSYDATTPYEYFNSTTADDDTVVAYKEALVRAASGYYNKFPNGLCGASVVGCTYELEDGSETWSTAFIVASAQRAMASDVKPTANTGDRTVKVYGVEKTWLNISFDSASTAAGVRKINVYASRPVYPHEVSSKQSNVVNFSDVELSELKLDGQLMYYQGSVSPEENEARLLLDFGMTQASEKVMEVLPGCIERIGNAIAYNNRFHYFRTEAEHIIQTPTASAALGGRVSGGKTYMPFVLINNNFIKVNTTFRINTSSPQDFIYPMAGIKKIAFVEATSSNGVARPTFTESMFVVDLKDSNAYNYSYAFDVVPELGYNEEVYNNITAGGQGADFPFVDSVLWKKEFNAINVSEPYNPFVFPVNYSYSFGGEIRDIATSYLPISSTQIGQYPVTVFTTSGIYSLEQGSGNTLYSNIIPISPYVITDKALPTPHGTVFGASNNLYVLAGREAVCISAPLSGKRDLDIRESDSYVSLCESPVGNFMYADYLSGIDFDKLHPEILLYDQMNDEVIITSSRSDVNYSYVFNFNTRSYHKIPKKYSKTPAGSRYVIEENGGVKSIIDMFYEKEGEQHIFMQSRPLPLEVVFTHIQRMILYIDANLNGDQHLLFSVFGSDNLCDWKCIISAQKAEVALRQIRTNKAGRSYRDYIVLINGLVDTGTDLSEIIADYTVASRRLG